MAFLVLIFVSNLFKRLWIKRRLLGSDARSDIAEALGSSFAKPCCKLELASQQDSDGKGCLNFGSSDCPNSFVGTSRTGSGKTGSGFSGLAGPKSHHRLELARYRLD